MRNRGHTLLELLAAVVVVATLLAIGVPALNTIVLDARRTANVNAFVSAIQLARSESAKRAAPVTLCKSGDRAACGGAATHYEHGWIAFVDDDSRTPAAGDTLLLTHDPVGDGTIRSNRPEFTFRPWYRRSTNGTIAFCDRRGPSAARAVIVSYTGRPRVSATRPDGRPLECPG